MIHGRRAARPCRIGNSRAAGAEEVRAGPKEAAKLGFDSATLPRRIARGNRPMAAPDGLRLAEIGHIADLVAQFAAEPADVT